MSLRYTYMYIALDKLKRIKLYVRQTIVRIGVDIIISV